MSDHLRNKEIEVLKEQGFLLLKNIFTTDEVEVMQEHCMRECSLRSFNSSVPGDIFENDLLRSILFKKEVINIMETILEDEVVYFRDSQIHCAPNKRIFHLDSRADYRNPRLSTYPIYRLGVFMQEHVNYSGGIKFRVNSHRRIIFNKLNLRKLLSGKGFHNDPLVYLNMGKVVNVKANLGDLIIWNLRTEHSGGAVITKLFNNSGFMPFIDEWIPEFLKKPEHSLRMAIFFALAKDTEELRRYIEYKKNNQKDTEHRETFSRDIKFLQSEAQRLGLKFLD